MVPAVRRVLWGVAVAVAAAAVVANVWAMGTSEAVAPVIATRVAGQAVPTVAIPPAEPPARPGEAAASASPSRAAALLPASAPTTSAPPARPPAAVPAPRFAAAAVTLPSPAGAASRAPAPPAPAPPAPAAPSPAPSAPMPPSSASSPAPAPAPPPPAPAPQFSGPVVRVADRDLPDPFILQVGATWWLYATGSGTGNLQVASSPDLRTWGPSSDPLPTLPSWAEPGFTWAPSVLARGSGFVLYYSVRDAALGRQCISAAVSPSPGGPFVDASPGPMVCQASNGGSIDPQPFVAPDGTAYLLWKSDDNALGTRTRIGGEQLGPDGLSLAGPRPALLTADEPWQDGVVEGPAMVAASGHYYLFYGANHWDTPGSAIGYAVCTTPLGPCANHAVTRPWLAGQGPIVGPSGPDAFVDAQGTVHLAFAAWAPGAGGQQVRALWSGTLAFPP
jgi:hypothetical protein